MQLRDIPLSQAALVSFYTSVRHAVNRHGVAGVLQRAVKSAMSWHQPETGPDVFDREHGTDTAGIVPLWKLRVDGPHREHGVRYQAANPVELERCLAALPIEHERFTYVDLGSGKGRTLLVAAQFPFQEVLGVEFAPELHAIAEDNLRLFSGLERRARAVRSMCADAAAVDLPRSDLVLFLYNPFGAAVLAKVVARLEQSLETHDRTVYVLYRNPLARHVLDASPAFEALPAIDGTDVFVHRPRATRDTGD